MEGAAIFPASPDPTPDCEFVQVLAFGAAVRSEAYIWDDQRARTPTESVLVALRVAPLLRLEGLAGSYNPQARWFESTRRHQ